MIALVIIAGTPMYSTWRHEATRVDDGCRQHGSQSRALYAEPGKAQQSEDQQRVQYEVQQRRGGDHLAFEQGIAARPDRGQRSPQRHVQGRDPVPGAHVIVNQRHQFGRGAQRREHGSNGGQAGQGQHRGAEHGERHGVDRKPLGTLIVATPDRARYAGSGARLEADADAVNQPDQRQREADRSQRRLAEA
jgi:hypothetical protein